MFSVNFQIADRRKYLFCTGENCGKMMQEEWGEGRESLGIICWGRSYLNIWTVDKC